MKLSILIASIGRKTLQDTVKSLNENLYFEDEVLIVMDGCERPQWVEEMELKPVFKFIEEPKRLGYYGHPIRTKYQGQMTGNYILNVDDDDVYTKGFREAMEAICKREDNPDIIVFPHYVKYSNGLEGRLQYNDFGQGHILSSSCLFRNIAEITSIPYSIKIGSDRDRVTQGMRGFRWYYSDFPLFKYNKH